MNLGKVCEKCILQKIYTWVSKFSYTKCSHLLNSCFHYLQLDVACKYYHGYVKCPLTICKATLVEKQARGQSWQANPPSASTGIPYDVCSYSECSPSDPDP